VKCVAYCHWRRFSRDAAKSLSFTSYNPIPL
jgi:hypothetical protein